MKAERLSGGEAGEKIYAKTLTAPSPAPYTSIDRGSMRCPGDSR
jgi:hypothetical protein